MLTEQTPFTREKPPKTSDFKENFSPASDLTPGKNLRIYYFFADAAAVFFF